MSRCTYPCAVDRRNGPTQLDADGHRFCARESLACGEKLLQRLSLDQLHPQADLIPDSLGSMNGDDVGVPNLREQTAFGDDGRCTRLVGR